MNEKEEFDLSQCKHLSKVQVNAIETSKNYTEYFEKINLHNVRRFDIEKVMILSSYLNSNIINETFINAFLTKANIGLNNFNNDRCICERFDYISLFKGNEECFYKIFKNTKHFLTNF